MRRQHLIFDADDTLWENNVYFERAFDEFCVFLNHSSMTPDAIRTALDEIEIANNRIHGYGALNYGRNLSQCYLKLAERGVRENDLGVVMSYARRILSCPMELLPDVAETLPALAEHHELTLFTKGHPDEQSLKIDRSGLRPCFTHCAIVKEKNREAYLNLANDRGFDLGRAWMIGNSPKSDINPALAAGMRAVFVPHERTWGLEKEELLSETNGRLKIVRSFVELRELFAGPAGL
ncbi:MAG: HAD family hydrolase [Acidobacteriota bacterium]|nr:HAD family hydrolase [Acidobacteriota bacterium]